MTEYLGEFAVHVEQSNQAWPKPTRRDSCLDLMKQKVDSEAGRAQYSIRMWTIGPVFGNITSNK